MIKWRINPDQRNNHSHQATMQLVTLWPQSSSYLHKTTTNPNIRVARSHDCDGKLY